MRLILLTLFVAVFVTSGQAFLFGWFATPATPKMRDPQDAPASDREQQIFFLRYPQNNSDIVPKMMQQGSPPPNANQRAAQ
ncbi:unnamed protein product, partial [Mesorhabditis spiculigera]